MEPVDYLDRVAHIVRGYGLSVNRTVYTPVAEFPSVPAIVDSTGRPVTVLLMEPLELPSIRRLQTALPVTCVATEDERHQLLEVLRAGEVMPDYPQSTQARWVTAFGETRTVQQWARMERCAVIYETLRKRIENGWDPERAISEPAARYPQKSLGRKTLFRHASGQWAKKIQGKTHYFGSGTYAAAHAAYLERKEAIEDGRPEIDRTLTAKDLVNRFLSAKEDERDRGSIGTRVFMDYQDALGRALVILGSTTRATALQPESFNRLHRSFAEGVSPRTCGNRVRLVVAWVNWVNASSLLQQPIQTGPDFRPPSQLTLRRRDAETRRQHGLLMFEPDEIRILLGLTKSSALRAMILLGLNCGMGNTDCAKLPQSAIDFDTGWLNYPRPKTLIPRRAELWPETLAALQEAIALRPNPAEEADSDAVFLTRRGTRWVHQERHDDSVTKEFSKILRAADMKRHGLSFYSLRRTFQTLADEHGDDPATKRIMGHADSSMSAVYRQRFPDHRLSALSEFVHGRLQPLILSQQQLDELATRRKKIVQ